MPVGRPFSMLEVVLEAAVVAQSRLTCTLLLFDEAGLRGCANPVPQSPAS